MTVVPLRMLVISPSDFTIWYVVELSRPVEISSMNSALSAPTIISPSSSSKRVSKRSDHRSCYDKELSRIFAIYQL
jgi:hypothetical protein